MAASAPPRDFPYWLVAALAIGVAAAIAIWRSDLYSQVFATVGAGLGITVRVTLIGFALASALGLCVCLLGLSQS
ncbi:amino acid ABC transporter permease, partial [Salmonella enterica subsp. enterica serovar Enteritidis]|nr:amino acid ABC transporter permease [Salmonella enterica subsp. enterica serovar Enteritidis]